MKEHPNKIIKAINTLISGKSSNIDGDISVDVKIEEIVYTGCIFIM